MSLNSTNPPILTGATSGPGSASASITGVAPIEVDGSGHVSIDPATTGHAGSMSAADKTILNNLAGGQLVLNRPGGGTVTIRATDSADTPIEFISST